MWVGTGEGWRAQFPTSGNAASGNAPCAMAALRTPHPAPRTASTAYLAGRVNDHPDTEGRHIPSPAETRRVGRSAQRVHQNTRNPALEACPDLAAAAHRHSAHRRGAARIGAARMGAAATEAIPTHHTPIFLLIASLNSNGERLPSTCSTVHKASAKRRERLPWLAAVHISWALAS